MFRLTEDPNEFWDEVNEKQKLIIYGAGYRGDIIGKMVQDAGIPFEIYIDWESKFKGQYLNDRIITTPSCLMEEYHTEQYNILVTNNDLLGAIAEIKKSVNNAFILLPNRLKGYNQIVAKCRRKKLLRTDFSIISNTCAGGFSYANMDCQYLSPTVGVIIEAEEFIKLCSDLRNYMEAELKFEKYAHSSLLNKQYPIGRLKDIAIHFVHYPTWEEALNNWEMRKERINYENLYFIFDELHYSISYNQAKRFLEIPYDKKIIFKRRTMFSLEKTIFTKNDLFLSNNGQVLYEEWFDLVEWINGKDTYE